MAETNARIEELVSRHNFSAEAVAALARALRAGGGTAAQFSHPEFGGMGQWSRGGMIMIGDMFNETLKLRVARLCDDLARDPEEAAWVPAGDANGSPPASAASGGWWWPEDLGRPSSAGTQNDMRYAFFPQARRLAIQRNGVTELYDTGEHRLSGFSQAQSTGQTLAFSGQHGPVDIASLSKLDAPSRVDAAQLPGGPKPHGGPDPFAGLERLAELHSKGVVTTEEFAAKKRDLLARI